MKIASYPEGNNIIRVEAQLTDEKGVPCLDAANLISFEIAGDGKLLQNLGTSTGSRKVQAYNGKAIIRAQVTDACYVSVQSDGIKTVYTQLNEQ